MRAPEPLEVPMARTLLALARWHRRDQSQRLTVASAAVADFVLRFPIVLDDLARRAGRPLRDDSAATESEIIAPENDQLPAQYAAWPPRHRIVVGALVGRRLAELSAGLDSQHLQVTPRGAAAAADLQVQPAWTAASDRAQALSRLRLAPSTLIQRCDAWVANRS